LDSSPCILVATLGGQPQVVTFALDALLAQGELVREVIVIHVSPEGGRLRGALARLEAEFPGDTYQGQPCRFRRVPIRAGVRLLADIRDETDADATWTTVHDLIGSLKAQRQRLHVCVAGGRRLMALLTISAAMMHFGHQDRLWHLYTPDEFRRRAAEGAIMHARPEDGVRLIQVPVAPWSAYFPALRPLLGAPPSQVLAAQMQLMDEAERARCDQVWARLSDREREVLRAFAAKQTPQEVAERLNITVKTVDTHKTKILGECRNAWELAVKSHLDYRFLWDKFGRYFDQV